MERDQALQGPAIELDLLASSIASLQRPSGEIPWHEGGKTDPWDHVEAAIGLTIGGRYEEARKAFEWLASRQLEDGSWYSAYRDGVPEDLTRESNMSSYIAVGVFHYYLVTRDKAFLEYIWPTVSAGIDFAVGLQAPTGAVYWARNPAGEVDPVALLTASSSVFMSLKCALVLALLLGESRPRWQSALKRLGDAIRYRPHLFDRTKSRYSMDWFYPVLCGALTGLEAKNRIERFWNRFMVEGLGTRCVSDNPWITVAETSELILTLAAMGEHEEARRVLGWIHDKRYDDGSYWCGFTFPDMVVWPEEKLTWTNAAVMMAFDALNHVTPASQLFSHTFWEAGKGDSSHMYRFLKKHHPVFSIKRAFYSDAADMRA
ncbi:MAG TPA: phenyltransferase domain-containing protein [Deltaproteobacteria bacterium]|nr:phenyltransferase domain-containing protein [Deltaproteobacteria bacterium]HOM30007.1 phenyltransferase domain-containing protein [Deltaproteobacteria bacterium]HPP79506.1 phenyltransferase domain-containing protein [Deltaproteobacteria bacterium]